MCTVCEEDFARVGKHRCTECLPADEPYYFFILLYIVFLLLFSLYILRSNIKTAKSEHASVKSVLLRIMTNHI